MPMQNPVHPGRIIKSALQEMGLTVSSAAKALNVSRPTLSTLVNEKSGVSPEMAVRLSRIVGSTPSLWLRLQMAHDLAKVEQRGKDIIVYPPHLTN